MAAPAASGTSAASQPLWLGSPWGGRSGDSWGESRGQRRPCDHPSQRFLLAVPSQPPENVRALSITSDVAVISWSEPPRSTLNGVLKGYRVIFWSLYMDGGGLALLWLPFSLGLHSRAGAIGPPSLGGLADHPISTGAGDLPVSQHSHSGLLSLGGSRSLPAPGGLDLVSWE